MQAKLGQLLLCPQESKHVILVFSVQGSGHFQGDGSVKIIFILYSSCNRPQTEKHSSYINQFLFLCVTGYAQMTSAIGKDKSPEFGSSSLSGVFSVEWVKKYGYVITKSFSR